MRSDTIFADAVHLKGTDLNFQRLTAGTQNRGVQRLVHIGLGHSHIVLKATGNGAPHAVHNAQRTIAVLNCIDQNTNSQQIINLTQLLVVTQHLFVNAIKVFGAALDFTANPRLLHCILQRGHSIINHGLALAALNLNLLHQIIVNIRLHIAEGQIL